MLTGFDALTGFQICMVIFLSVFSFRYRKHCSENLAYFLPVPVLYILWACVVIYYFADFFFMAVLWFLLGNFLSVGIAVLLRKKMRRFYHEQAGGEFYYPCAGCMFLFLLGIAIVLAGIQCLVFYMPLLVHSWVFNELLGFIPGLGIGFLLGNLFAAFFLSVNQDTEEIVIKKV